MKYFFVFFIIVLTSACVSEPTIQAGPNAEMSFDGLTRVDNAKMKFAWIKADLDLSSYNKIKLQSAGIEYRSVKPVSRLSNSNRSEFPMDERQKSRFQSAVREVFLGELGKSSRFEIVTEAGPDVLSLTGALLDVVSAVPPQTVGRVDFYITEIGQATLVLELRDSQSGEIFARTIDRRAVETTFVQRSNPVTNMAEAKRALRRWAVNLREGLERVLELASL